MLRRARGAAQPDPLIRPRIIRHFSAVPAPWFAPSFDTRIREADRSGSQGRRRRPQVALARGRIRCISRFRSEGAQALPNSCVAYPTLLCGRSVLCPFSPRVDSCACLPQVSKPAYIQKLVAEFSVEAFQVRILHRLARPDINQLDLPIHSPAQEMPRGEFAAVVHPQPLRPASFGNDRVEHARHPLTREARIHLQCQAPTCERINDPQHSHRASVRRSVVHEVQAPLLIRRCRLAPQLTDAHQPLPPFAFYAETAGGRSGIVVCDSPFPHRVEPISATGDSHSTVCLVPTPPIVSATVHRVADLVQTGMWISEFGPARGPGVRWCRRSPSKCLASWCPTARCALKPASCTRFFV